MSSFPLRPYFIIKMNEEQEHQKQEITIERNKRIIRITLYVLFIALILLIARLLLMVLGICNPGIPAGVDVQYTYRV